MDSLFGSPQMLWWGTAASVPVIIHLLSRRRFKRVPWAAMDFLERAFKKTRKRIRIENILLMLLRAALLIFLALALADPRTSSAGLFSGEGESRNAIILLDNSYSMRLQDNRDETAFDRSRSRALKLLDELNPESDSVALIVLGAPARIVVPLSREIEQVRSALQSLEPSDIGTDLLGGLKIANGLVQEQKLSQSESSTGVWVLGDMQKEAFLAASTVANEADAVAPVIDSPDPLFEKNFRDLREAGGQVYFFDGGDQSDRPNNVAVVDLVHRGKALVQGITTAFEARIRNFGADTASGELQFFVDSEEAFIRRERVPDFKGRDTGSPEELERSFVFDATFATAGWHYVSVKWMDDNLDTDNVRRFAFEVRERIRVLAVDGSARQEIEDTATFFLARALDPSLGTDRNSAFQVKEVNAIDLRNEKLENFDIVVLCDVERLDPNRHDALLKWVEAGGSLLYYAGPSLEGTLNTSSPLSNYVELGRDSLGLLPFTVESLRGNDEFIEDPFQLQFTTFQHPATAYFEDPKIRPGLTRMPVWRFAVVKLHDDARVLATFRSGGDNSDAAKTWPALIESDLGSGRVLAITTSANRAWNLYGATPAFVPFNREIGYHLASHGRRDNLIVGESATVSFPANIETVKRLAKDETPLTLKTKSAGGRSELTLSRIDEAGLIRLEPVDPSGIAQPHILAVNVDTRESDLARAGRGWLVANFGSELFSFVDDDQEIVARQGRNSESSLWRFCLYLVLAFMVTESIFALLFGRRQHLEAVAS